MCLCEKFYFADNFKFIDYFVYRLFSKSIKQIYIFYLYIILWREKCDKELNIIIIIIDKQPW